MPLAARGAFIDLLAVSWLASEEPCTIPPADTDLAALLGVSVDEWKAIAPRVLAEFDDTTATGRLRNARLWKEWQRMRTEHKRKSQGGRTSALRRRDSHGRLLPSSAQDRSQESTKTLSANQSQNQSQNQEKETTTPDVDRVLAHYVACHPRRRPGRSDRLLVQRRLRSGISAETLCDAITGNRHDPWHVERKKHELAYVLREGKLYDFAEKAHATREAIRPGIDFWDNTALQQASGGAL
jgi:uncharacterized protein YdaU (DUF1376 family)